MRNDPRAFWNKLGGRSGLAAAIDPRDVRGRKNFYISLVRDRAIADEMGTTLQEGVILDFGCGTGTFLSEMHASRPGLTAIGVDLSLVMLRHALARDTGLAGKVFLYDGVRLPFRDESIDVITMGGVLLYVRREEDLLKLCNEFERVLCPGGKVVAVEQIRKRDYVDEKNLKIQRSPKALQRIFGRAGLQTVSWRQVRRGRFPMIYAIRYGIVPVSWHGTIAALEAALWKRVSPPRLDYADAVFVFRKAKYPTCDNGFS